MNPSAAPGRLRRRLRRNERGASAIFVALMMTVIMAAGALGLDVSKLVFERQQVRSAVDAAAQIGAAQLSPAALGISKATALETAIKTAAVKNYGATTYGKGLVDTDVTVTFYCVVASKLVSGKLTPDTSQIPDTCRPDPTKTDYTTNTTCDAASCAIPCDPKKVAAAVCNAIRVSATKEVKYVLAPAVGIPNPFVTAKTVSCQGSCGGPAAPNPMDVVLMADRTGSMSSTALTNMKTGIENMLTFMNQRQQYVAFGAIGISANSSPTDSGSVKIKTATRGTQAFSDADYAKYDTSGKTLWDLQGKLWKFNGTWIPIGFSHNYQNTGSGPITMNTTSELGSAVRGLAASNSATYPSPWHTQQKDRYGNWENTGCTESKWMNLKNCDTYGQYESEAYNNTHLASALKAAVQYSLYNDPADATDRAKLGTPKKVVIFETDGSPSETFNSGGAALSIEKGNDWAIGATDPAGYYPIGAPKTACENFSAIADAAKKTEKLTIITIAVGDAVKPTNTCGDRPVGEMLAAAATDRPDGKVDTTNVCSSDTERAVENADGDNYYCASDTDELKKVFKASLGNVIGGTKFMAIDGVGD